MAKEDQNQQDQNFRHLVRVASTDLDGNKQIVHAMRKIKGVDVMFANAVVHESGVEKSKKTGTLTDKEVEALNDVFQSPSKYNIPKWMYNRRKDYETGKDVHLIGGDLDFTKDSDIKRLKKTKSNRGMRHAWGLTLRGQRTKANFRKNKGKLTGGKRK